MTSKKKESALIVALDFSSLNDAEKIVKKISSLVKIFKVGKELFTSAGPAAVEMIHSYKCRVFLDLKFHDIPNTVGSACQVAAKMGVFMMNVHTLGGKAMMIAAMHAVRKTTSSLMKNPQSAQKVSYARRDDESVVVTTPRRSNLPAGQAGDADEAFSADCAPKILGVTVLTSLKDLDLKQVGIQKKVKREVRDLALLAQKCGLDGVVASGQEIQLIRNVTGKNFLIVTPGVRPIWASHGDQKRIVTPKQAINLGADYIVVGRPITQHPQPLIAVKKILNEIAGH